MSERGFTLIETTVVLLLISILFGVAGLSVTSLGVDVENGLAKRLVVARDSAVRYQIPVTVETNGRPVTFFSDGSARGLIHDSDHPTLRVDPWTGRVVYD